MAVPRRATLGCARPGDCAAGRRGPPRPLPRTRRRCRRLGARARCHWSLRPRAPRWSGVVPRGRAWWFLCRPRCQDAARRRTEHGRALRAVSSMGFVVETCAAPGWWRPVGSEPGDARPPAAALVGRGKRPRAVRGRVPPRPERAMRLDPASPPAVAEAAEQQEQHDDDENDGEHGPRTGLSSRLITCTRTRASQTPDENRGGAVSRPGAAGRGGRLRTGAARSATRPGRLKAHPGRRLVSSGVAPIGHVSGDEEGGARRADRGGDHHPDEPPRTMAVRAHDRKGPR
jgi:hypothetical protein